MSRFEKGRSPARVPRDRLHPRDIRCGARAIAARAAAAPASTVEQVVERAGLALGRYAEDLSVIIGTEHYAQYQGNEGFERAAKRLLVSEFALVSASITVSCKQDERLGLLLPSEMARPTRARR